MPELKFSRADLAKNTGLALQQESVTYRGFLSEKAINVGMMAAQTVAESGQILTLAEVEQMEKFLDKENYYASLWWYSLWMVQSREPAVFRRMIDYILAQREHFSTNTLFFLYYYLVSKKFVIPEIKFSDTFESLMALKDEVLSRYGAEIGEIAPLPCRERNKNLVVILTGQLLGEKHAPTTHALSYVAALQDMGYETEIINTAECLSDMGAVPVFEVARGEYITGLIGRRLVKWRNRQVVCTQCEPTMPNTPTIKEILAYLRQRKPLLVISIDNGDVTGHFCQQNAPGARCQHGIKPAFVPRRLQRRDAIPRSDRRRPRLFALAGQR